MNGASSVISMILFCSLPSCESEEFEDYFPFARKFAIYR